MILDSTLYITSHSARVGVSKGAIEIRESGVLTGRFPLEALGAVVVTARASVSTEAIGRCADRGVRFAVLKRGGGLRFAVSGPVDGSVLLRTAQLQHSEMPEMAAGYARQFIRGKLANQAHSMLRWAERAPGHAKGIIQENAHVLRERIAYLGGVGDLDVIRGVEGDSARRYFKAMGHHLRQAGRSPFEFVKRSRRPPRDPANALLSFVYGLATVRIGGALEAVGLDPQVGFLHGLRSGRPSLALDLLEEHRPLLDRLAVRLMTRGELGGDHFVVTAGGAHYLSDDGRRILFAKWDEFLAEMVEHPLLRQRIPRGLVANVQATLLARAIRGDLDTYPPVVFGA